MADRDEGHWLHDMHDIREELKIDAGNLHAISRAFSRTGNLEMSTELYEMACNINTQAKRIDKATSEITSLNLRRAQESSANMLGAILAGIEVEKSKGE